MSDLNPKLVEMVPQIEDAFNIRSHIHNNFLVEFFEDGLETSLFTLALNKESGIIVYNINIDYSDTHMLDFILIYETLKVNLIKDLELGKPYYIDLDKSYHFDNAALLAKYRDLQEDFLLFQKEESEEDLVTVPKGTFISREPLLSSFTKDFNLLFNNSRHKGKKSSF